MVDGLWRFAVVATAVAAAALVILLISMGWMTATIVSLIGIGLTAAVSAVGLSIQNQANGRSQTAAREENRRLQLEAAMKAASVFAPPNGVRPDQASVGAALLALCDLGQVELAVALLGDTWRPPARAGADGADRPTLGLSPDVMLARFKAPHRDSLISTATAILVIDKALSSDNAGAQVMAAELLCRNSRSLRSTSTVDWPSCIDGKWRAGLPDIAKLFIMDALIRMAVADKPERLALSALAARLFGIYDGEPDSVSRFGETNRFRWCASRMLHAVMPALHDIGWKQVMGRRREPIPLKALESAAVYAHDWWPVPDHLRDLELERYDWLQDWSKRCTAFTELRHPLGSAR